MKKIFYIIACVFFSINAQANDGLAADKIYFFTYDGCPYCKMADEYISQNMPYLQLEKVDVHKPAGFLLFKKCAEKFKLGREVGTPLFCIGDDYIMGWSDENRERFTEIIAKFNK